MGETEIPVLTTATLMIVLNRLVDSMTRRIAACVVSLALLVGPASAETGRIVILNGQDHKPYQDVLAGLKQSLLQQGIDLSVETHAVQGDPQKTAAALTDVKQTGARLVVTLGSTATKAAVRDIKQIPILATMIVTADDLESAPNATAVLLDFPLDTQMQWVRRAVPDASTVGVLYNPAENQSRVDAAILAAKGTGLKLVAQAVESPRTLPDGIDNLFRNVDVLWTIADSVVMTPQTAERLILSAFRHKIPFVGLSHTWVKAGALYALDRDYIDIGQQCGAVAGKLLHGTDAKAIPPAYPRKVTHSVNLKTAGALNLELTQDLIRGAEQVFR